jgi:hypothetical protein
VNSSHVKGGGMSVECSCMALDIERLHQAMHVCKESEFCTMHREELSINNKIKASEESSRRSIIVHLLNLMKESAPCN